MNIHEYLLETEYAVKVLIQVIQEDTVIKEILEEQLKGIELKIEFYSEDYLRRDFNDDYSPAQAMDSYRHFGHAYNEREKILLKRNELQKKIETKCFSRKSLSGAILQIAKQGLSIVFQSEANCPEVKKIGEERLSNIIWQARNQSMHFEEGNYRLAVINCFKNLEDKFDSRFSLSKNPHVNFADEIIEILGWNCYENYYKDMSAFKK